MVNLQDRIAIVTGGSQGLGLAIATRFAAAGAGVVLIARSENDVHSAAEKLRKEQGGAVTGYAADVTDEKRIREVIRAAIAEYGRIDILVNNAAVHGPIGPLETTDAAAWRYALDVNLLGTVNMTRHLLPHFRRNNFGRIVNLSGGGATKGRPGFSCYAAAKAAIVRLTETVAMEVADADITVNAVAPGVLNTRLLAEALRAEEGRAQKPATSAQQPGGDMSSLENAAELCCYLVSAESGSISGRLISAVWDDWRSLVARSADLGPTDVYMLRRITAQERGFDWDTI